MASNEELLMVLQEQFATLQYRVGRISRIVRSIQQDPKSRKILRRSRNSYTAKAHPPSDALQVPIQRMNGDTILLTSEQVAEYLRVSEVTLERWRKAGTGPRYCKMGKRVAYPKEEVEKFIEQSTVNDRRPK